jgi:hypothetical protein
MKMRRGLIGIALALMAASPLIEPRLLAFPHAATVGADRVYSVAPLPQPTLSGVLARANRLARASPLAAGSEGRTIFLTDGGWRWRWLAGTAQGAFALTRPFPGAIIVNRADLAADRTFNGAALGGIRTLSGVIAHEKCHGMVRSHFGLIRAESAPIWLREGYCDHVARESSLTDAQANALEHAGLQHPALPYVRGRQKVDALLAANGGDVDRLFEAAR